MDDETRPWLQANITFPDWNSAEQTAATHLAPLLNTDDAAGTWWFIRKHPCWRIRYQPHPGCEALTERRLDALAEARHITGWTPAIYEPETHAFGGREAMTAAHRLFHADSHSILAYLHTQPDATHRREIALMLCTIIMRAAHQDWYEQGDIWARVAEHRTPLPRSRPAAPTSTAVRHFLTANAEPQMRDAAALTAYGQWTAAYADAGRELAALAADGHLHRGLRDVLTHHIIFAWNRIGLPYPTQAALAHTAKRVIFGPDPATEPA